MSSNQFNSDISLGERERKLAEMPDEDINFSDIPELDEECFQNAKLVKKKPRTQAISIRIDTDTLEWFRNYAKNNGSTELTMVKIAIMVVYRQLEQKLYIIKLLKTKSFAVQSFQALVPISFATQVR